MVKNVLEGSLRSIAGTLTIEELITDRDRFQQAVSEAARGDLEASGIHIDALTITSIRDTKGYIEQLGEKNLASVVRDARIAKAGASQEASVKENEAQRIIIAAERDREIARVEAHRDCGAHGRRRQRDREVASRHRSGGPDAQARRAERRQSVGTRGREFTSRPSPHDGEADAAGSRTTSRAFVSGICQRISCQAWRKPSFVLIASICALTFAFPVRMNRDCGSSARIRSSIAAFIQSPIRCPRCDATTAVPCCSIACGSRGSNSMSLHPTPSPVFSSIASTSHHRRPLCR